MHHQAILKLTAAVSVALTLLALAPGPVTVARAGSAVALARGRQERWANVEAFFDEIVNEQLAELHVAGAVVAVVRDGEIVLAKGYGDANVAQHVPVEASKTLFRIASVTKLFTWTAVMQLVEQGKLDLDTDVNAYLDFEIPATYEEPITLRHLMSHSAGFEDRVLGIFVPTTAHLKPAAQWLPQNLPARARPPGVASSYSNYGAALAGYIVERVSGIPYETYLEDNILHPLGMAHTSARQPLPPELAGDLSGGYRYEEGAFVAQPIDVLQTAPGGAMSATATDMAAFMIAHLQDGRYGENRILDEPTARQMHSTLFRHDARLDSGYAFGFEERLWYGQKVLSHSGDFQTFRSRLDLLPEQNVGMFVAYNSAMNDDLPAQLVEAFLTQFYPGAWPLAAAPGDFEPSAETVAGLYQSNRHAYSTAEKMLLLVQPVFAMRAVGNELVMTNPYNGETQRFVETDPLLFQQVDGPERLAFRQNSDGEVDLAFVESMPAIALEKLAWYERPLFNQALLGLTLLLFLSSPVAGLIGVARRHRAGYQTPTKESGSSLARIASWAMVAVAVLSWLFLLATALATGRLISTLGADALALRLLDGLILVPPVIVLLTAAAVALLPLVWRRRYWHLPGRIYYTALAIAAVGFVWFLSFWNLLGSA